ncbi:MAG: phosphomannomutase/phosphoglucomutase [Alphaproteobacteria bacterium]|nr:phosphomannomutase/phosphoglucomutase [Alphaproteobacteria bacterium]
MPQLNKAEIKAGGLDPVILREYDIRGQVGKNLSDDAAQRIGQAFGTYVNIKGGKKICVGFDGRLSSPSLSHALIQGLLSTGADVVNIGRGPTPMLYFAVKHLKADAGIMVTGSHNPPDYNGFKMTLLDEPVFGAAIQEIGRIAASTMFAKGAGKMQELDVTQAYINRLLQDFKGMTPRRVAWDAGNGAAGEIMRALTQNLPGTHILLHDKIDGTFPNHHPDPTVDENLRDLQKAVRENKCDLGIAFDGDGDRIGIVDEHGAVIRCDMLMTIYARQVLQTHPGAPIIADVKCSSVLFEQIAKMGGRPVMWKTGHSLIKDKMRTLNAPLAGELSGHIFFADHYYGYDDALYCAIRLLNALEDSSDGLSSLLKNIPTLHSTPEIRIDVREEEKFALVPRVHENLKDKGLDLSTIDGVRVTTEDGWWLLRASNTQSVLVARAEGKTTEGLERLKNMLADALGSVGYRL